MALSDKEIIAAANDWRAWGEQFGWRLTGVGSTLRDERGDAGFLRGDHSFTITREMRDDIDTRNHTKETQ